jgi:hypothetical protein
LVAGKRATARPCPDGFAIHEEAESGCFSWRRTARQWKNCIASRGILAALLVFFMGGSVMGHIWPEQWDWIKITMLALSGTALFIVSTVPDHFLKEHLWRHLAIKHVPGIFLWTFGALVAIHVISGHINVQQAITENKWMVLLVACLVGLIPESGPHLVFVTLYTGGAVPASILFANSIVQDGHGMLPMLAHSRRAFFGVKGINFLLGMLCGAAGLAMEM